MINDINKHIDNCIECVKYKSVVKKKKTKNITILSKVQKTVMWQICGNYLKN